MWRISESTLPFGPDKKAHRIMDIFTFKEGVRRGPYTVEQARQMLAEGQLVDSDYAWYTGLTEWTTLGAVPGVTSPLPPPAPAPVSAPPPVEVHATQGDGILLLKRLATAFVLFVVLFVFIFVVIYMLTMMVGGGIAGAQLAANSPSQGFSQGYAVGQEAGRHFVEQYGVLVASIALVLSFAISSVLSLWISFAGWLPWCRKR